MRGGTPEVSVVIPTFRRERQLADAIGSALDQDVRIEIIVIDDSPERSAENTVARFDPSRVRYLHNTSPSAGRPARVRNVGWPLATAPFIHFLDDDDRLHGGALNVLRSALERRHDVGVAFGRITPFGDDPVELQRQRAYFADAARNAHLVRWRPIAVARLLFRTTFLVNSACMIRRACLDELGGYDPTIPVCEDVEFYLRAIRRFGGIFVDQPVLHYRTGASSLMHDLNGSAAVAESYRLMYDKYRREHGSAEFLMLRALSYLNG